MLSFSKSFRNSTTQTKKGLLKPGLEIVLLLLNLLGTLLRSTMVSNTFLYSSLNKWLAIASENFLPLANLETTVAD